LLLIHAERRTDSHDRQANDDKYGFTSVHSFVSSSKESMIGFGQVRALKSPHTRKDRREVKNCLRIPACGWDCNQNFFSGANRPGTSAITISKGFLHLQTRVLLTTNSARVATFRFFHCGLQMLSALARSHLS
jgi:hypothetical protein